MIIMNNRKVLCTQPRFLVQYFYTQIHLKYCQEIAWVQYYVSRNEEQCVHIDNLALIFLNPKISAPTTIYGKITKILFVIVNFIIVGI